MKSGMKKRLKTWICQVQGLNNYYLYIIKYIKEKKMSRKKEQSETEKMNQQLGDALKMPVVQQPEPSQGTIEFAKDKKK